MTDSHSESPLSTSRSSNAWRMALGFSLLLLAISMTLFVVTLVQRLSANAEMERILTARQMGYTHHYPWSGSLLGKWLPKTWLPKGAINGLQWGCDGYIPPGVRPLSDNDLPWLTSFHTLEWLSLCETQLSDEALAQILAAHPRLQSLSIDGFSLDCLATIGELENLDILTIYGPWDCNPRRCLSESEATPMGSPWLTDLQKWRLRRCPRKISLSFPLCDARHVLGCQSEAYWSWRTLILQQGGSPSHSD